ncbi:MAG: hypothetical protein JXA71_04715 [Chitinispirillaceae bacterium]|nr:hypothetical protein [Chitinispirillaceae bacterium]
MRWITVSSMAAMFMVFCFSPFNAPEASQYVQISEPFVNIYEYLDPKSTVIKMAKKGDRIELIYAGPSWYNVKIGTKTGWVERKAGFVTDKPSILMPVLSILLIIAVLGGTIYGVIYYIQKQKSAEE